MVWHANDFKHRFLRYTASESCSFMPARSVVHLFVTLLFKWFAGFEASTMENRLLNAKTSYRLFHSKFYSRDQTRSIFFHAFTRKNLTYNIFRNFLYSQVICQYGNYINLDCCRYVYDIIERVDNYQ